MATKLTAKQKQRAARKAARDAEHEAQVQRDALVREVGFLAREAIQTILDRTKIKVDIGDDDGVTLRKEREALVHPKVSEEGLAELHRRLRVVEAAKDEIAKVRDAVGRIGERLAAIEAATANPFRKRGT